MDTREEVTVPSHAIGKLKGTNNRERQRKNPLSCLLSLLPCKRHTCTLPDSVSQLPGLGSRICPFWGPQRSANKRCQLTRTNRLRASPHTDLIDSNASERTSFFCYICQQYTLECLLIRLISRVPCAIILSC